MYFLQLIMNFKSFLAATTIAATAFIGGSAAQARTCMDFGYGALCNDYLYNNSYGQVYGVAYVNGSEQASMKVTCNDRNMVAWSGKKWSMTESQVRWVAQEFCALPNF